MKKQTKELKTAARSFFRKTKGISSPAFPKEKIIFNSKGLSHLFYKGSHKKSGRSDREIQARVSLLSRAVKILNLMPLLGQGKIILTQMKQKCNGQTDPSITLRAGDVYLHYYKRKMIDSFMD